MWAAIAWRASLGDGFERGKNLTGIQDHFCVESRPGDIFEREFELRDHLTVAGNPAIARWKASLASITSPTSAVVGFH